MICSSAPRSLLLAGAFVSVFTFGAAAQQPANPPPTAAAAPALPPGSPLIGRPDSEAAAKLAPVAPPPIAAAPDKLPTAKLKVPAGFNIEVYAAGMANARSLAEGDKGTVFVGSRLVGACLGALSAQRRCVQERHALHRRTVEGLQDRQGRRRHRQSAQANHDLRQPAQGRSPRLEVHRHRARQQTVRSGRTAR